jgi:hypothetical protein
MKSAEWNVPRDCRGTILNLTIYGDDAGSAGISCLEIRPQVGRFFYAIQFFLGNDLQ